MAANYWDNSDADNDGNNPNNWSLGTVPAGTDVATFDNTSDDNCTFTDNISCAGINVTSDYDGDVDLGANTFTIGSDGIILDGAGDFDWGGATVGITGGTLDVVDQATTTVGTASITLNGTCVLKGHNAKTFYDLTIPNGSTTTVHGDTVARAVVVGTCTISGAVVVSDVLAVTGDGDFVINSTASLTGGAYLYLIGCNSGHGITTLQAGASVACQVVVYNSVAGTVLAAGTYAGDVVLFGTSGNTTTLELSNGTYTFDGGLELWMNHATATINLDNVTNAPTINVTNLTIDGDAAGTINIDDSAGSAVAWNITGNIVDEIGTATFNYTKNANGGGWYLSSSNNQTIDFLGEDIGVIRDIDKSAGGTVTLENVTAELGTITALTDGLTIGTGATTTSDGAKAISTTLDMSAATSVNLGSDTWTLTDCDFDYNGIGTLTDGTSTVVFAGTCTWVAEPLAAYTLNNVTVNASATVTFSAGNGLGYVAGTLSNSGDITIDTGDSLSFTAAGNLDNEASGSIHGPGLLFFEDVADGNGITTQDGNVYCEVQLTEPTAGDVLVPATYEGKVYVRSDAASKVFRATAGTYVFAGDFEAETTGAGDTLQLDFDTNDPNLEFQGDFTLTESDADSVTYTKGTGALTFGRTPFAKVGGSCEFDGAADNVNCNDYTNPGDGTLQANTAATISAWIYIRSWGEDGSFARICDDGENDFFLNGSGGNDRLSFNAGSTVQSNDGALSLNRWHHVAVTRTSDGSDTKIYIDGAQNQTAAVDSGAPGNPLGDLIIGDRSEGGKAFDGYIDDLRIFNHVITSGEIATLYNNGAGTATALGDELLWYKFDEYAASTAVTDSGSGGNNGTAVRNRNLTNPAYKTITTLGETFEATTFDDSNDLFLPSGLGGAFEFDGAADYLTVDDHDPGTGIIGTGAASFSMWFYMKSWGPAANGWGRLFDNGRAIAFVNDAADNVVVNWDASAQAVSATNSLDLNTWHHLVVTRTAAGVTNFYIDGSASGTADQATDTPLAATTDTFVGDRAGHDREFDGYIADFRYFESVISAANIASLRAAGAGTTAAIGGEVLWYKCDDRLTTTAVLDSGSGDNDGTSVRNTDVIQVYQGASWSGTGDTWELQDKLTAESITHTAGTLDVNGQDLETTVGDFEVAGSALLTANGTLGSTITTAGATRIYGDAGALRDLDPGEAWTLTSTGPAVIYYATVGDLDASGSTDDARAYDSIDAGSNTNVVFVSIGIVAGIAENPGEMAFAAEDIMSGAASEMYKMTPNVVDVTSEKHDTDALSHVIYKLMCGTAGDIKVKFADGSTVTMPNVAAGFVHILPAPVSQVFSTGTAALEMFGFY